MSFQDHPRPKPLFSSTKTIQDPYKNSMYSFKEFPWRGCVVCSKFFRNQESLWPKKQCVQ